MYDTIHAAFYDLHSTGLDGDVDFYVKQASDAGSPVLELACGTGRIVIPVAEAGLDIVGLDASDEMLSVAREKTAQCTAEIQSHITLVNGDMRDFSLDRQFRLIMIPFRSFLHLLTPTDQRQALLNIHGHLQSDGKLVFNVFDPSVDIIAGHTGPGRPGRQKQGTFTHPETGNRVLVWDSRTYMPGRQRVDVDYIYEVLDEEGRLLETSYNPISLRYVHRWEMQYLLELCSFEVEALYGDFQGGPFRHGGEQVWIARKC